MHERVQSFRKPLFRPAFQRYRLQVLSKYSEAPQSKQCYNAEVLKIRHLMLQHFKLPNDEQLYICL